MDLGNLARRLFSVSATESVQSEQPDPLAACTLILERQSIASCVPRTRATVAGLVRDVRQVDDTGSPCVTVIVEDEEGEQLKGVWHGRRELPGVVPGIALALTGTVIETRGARKMLDPSYTIVSPTSLP